MYEIWISMMGLLNIIQMVFRNYQMLLASKLVS